jgi:hypothetical protein
LGDGVKLERPSPSARGILQCVNPACREQVPAAYAKEHERYPPAVVSAVGWRAHGKTVFFASLMYSLRKLGLEQLWPDYFMQELDESSLEVVTENMDALDSGQLPDASQKNFPRPTMLRLHGIPGMPRRTLLLYDTSGECFERPTQLVNHAGFVKRAHTVVILFSLPSMSDPPRQMHKLLTSYLDGMAELTLNEHRPPKQNLLVVYTQADDAARWLCEWPALTEHLCQNSLEGLGCPHRYMKELRFVSEQLAEFTRETLQAGEFCNLVRRHFRRVRYCMVSSLGAKPAGNRLTSKVVPRRILDPVFWVLENSLPFWERWFRQHVF